MGVWWKREHVTVFHATLMSTADIFNIVGLTASHISRDLSRGREGGWGRYNSSIPEREVIPRRREHVSDPIVFRRVAHRRAVTKGPLVPSEASTNSIWNADGSAVPFCGLEGCVGEQVNNRDAPWN